MVMDAASVEYAIESGAAPDFASWHRHRDELADIRANQTDPVGSRPVSVRARELALRALSPSALAPADELQAASDAAAGVIADGLTGAAWRAYAVALSALAEIARWDAATIAADVDAERRLRAARRRAEVEADAIDHHPELVAAAAVLRGLMGVETVRDARLVAGDLARIPLPLPLIPSASPSGPQVREPVGPPEPRVVCLVSHDGDPVVAPAVVRPGRVYEFTITARVLDWPEDLPELTIRPMTVWPHSATEATAVRLTRPTTEVDGLHEVQAVSNVVLHATGSSVSFSLSAVFGDGIAERPAMVLAYTRFELRPFDPVLDLVTGIEVVDGRLRELLATLRGQVPDRELAAFARMLSATSRAAVRIQENNIFRRGVKVTENEFQTEMETRLGMAEELAGPLGRVNVAGGITDLVHDDIVLELKVSLEEVTREVAERHVGQPVQYATGLGRQLSILCFLDMSEKTAPVGILANSLYLLEPELHGSTNPRHSSWVGVVVISSNLPIPSAWSGAAVTSR